MADESIVASVQYVRVVRKVLRFPEEITLPATFLGIATGFFQITTNPSWGQVDLEIGLAHEDGRTNEQQHHFNMGRLASFASITQTGEKGRMLPLWQIHDNPDDPTTVILRPFPHTSEEKT